MSALMEIADAMLSAAQRRLELVSQNVTNLNTYGYRASSSFSDYIGLADAPYRPVGQSTNFSSGALASTGNPLDLALSGAGYFRVQGAGGEYLTRAGQFHLDANGQVVDSNGLFLLSADGNPIQLGSDQVEVLENGTILEGGFPIDRIGIASLAEDEEMVPMGGTYFSVSSENLVSIDAPVVRQAMLETSNVEMASEMIDMMSSVRQAEMGARIVQTYDALTERAISTFGRGGR